MILKLFEPAYYRNLYSIEPEISILLQNLTTYYSDKEYSDSFNKISITTAIATKEVYSSGLWEEEVKCWKKSCDCYICSRVDFDMYYQSDIKMKKIILLASILKSIKKIEKKAKFKYSEFENDLFKFCQLNNIDIDMVKEKMMNT